MATPLLFFLMYLHMLLLTTCKVLLHINTIYTYLHVFCIVQFPVALTNKEDVNDFNKEEDAHDPEDLDVFEPSHKWRTLKPGKFWFLLITMKIP